MADAPNKPDHPLFNGKVSVGMISGENPRFPAQASGHAALGEALQQMGVKAEEREGRYGSPEKSWMVYGPSREQMYQLGKTFGQESVVYSSGGKHELLYTNGPQAGKFHPAMNDEFFQHPPEDYYTNMPELGGFLRLNFDWNTLHPSNLHQDAAVQALHDRAAHQANTQPPEQADRTVTKAEIKAGLAQVLRKAIGAVRRPHPHAYDWHNEHTDHHLHVMSPGVVLRSSQGMAKAEPHPHMDGSKPGAANDQAAGVGVSTYGKFAMPYGTVDKTQSVDLFHYPYQGKNQEIDRLVKDHGYNTYYAGGKHGRPDLAQRNYNTKHLMVYDPSPGSGGDFGTEAYTDGWRKIHELSHALTYPQLNEIYGEGRRIGKLGHHRSLREALRAVHWEWLAAHKQRELSQQIGVNVPDHVFHRELNTVMHDAIHRAVTGKFTEPSGEGFKPHDHKLPLEHALGMVREAAHNLGITGMHDLIKKNEGTDTMADDMQHEPKEWRLALAKGLRDRVDAYSKEMLELRQRELKKNLGADPALAAPAPVMKPVDMCPLCGKEDAPGKCMCLQGPAMPPVAKAERVPGMSPTPPIVPKPKPAGEKPVQKTMPLETGSMPAVKAEMCKSCGKEHMDKCGLDEVKPGPALDKKEFSSDAKAKEPVKGHKSGGNGVKIRPLNKAYVSPSAMHGVSKPVKGPAPAPKPVSDADHAADKKAAGLTKGALPGTPKGDALQAAHVAGAKPAAAAAKPKLPGMGAQAGRAQMFADHMPKPAAPAAPAAAAPKLTGMAKIAAAGAQPIANKLGGAPAAGPKLPGMGAKPAMPAPGVGGLKAPPAPAAAKPAGAPPAAGGAAKVSLPKPMSAPKPAAAAPKPPVPMGKGEQKPDREKIWGDRARAEQQAAKDKKSGAAHSQFAQDVRNGNAGRPWIKKSEDTDLRKSLGNCLLCNKDEHSGSCS